VKIRSYLKHYLITKLTARFGINPFPFCRQLLLKIHVTAHILALTIYTLSQYTVNYNTVRLCLYIVKPWHD